MVEMRSRGGCANCRKRRRKCSEERPRCQGCIQRNLPCQYPVRLQWASTVTPSQRPAQAQTRSQRNARRTSATSSATRRRPSATGCATAVGQREGGLTGPVFRVPDARENPGFISNATAVVPSGDFFACVSPPLSQAAESPESQNAGPRRAGDACEGSSPPARGASPGMEEFDEGDEDADEDEDEDEDALADGWEFNDSAIFGDVNPEHFGDASERLAFAYWLNYLSRVLPAFDSAANPYRKLSSLALASPVLLDTILSLATEYMYCHGRASPDLVMKRHDKALGSLRTLLTSCETEASSTLSGQGGATTTTTTTTADNRSSASPALSSKQATLAAVLLQIANLVFIGGSGVEIHLACAMHFLRDLGYIDQPVQDFVPRLLVQRFAIIDVTTAILRRRRPHLPAHFWLFRPDEHYDRTVPSFREMTGCPQPLLGFLSRIAHLAVDVADAAAAAAAPHRPDGEYSYYTVLRTASTLETDMRIYARSRVRFATTRPAQSRHLDSLSQCFYWSAHLLLQRQVYRDAADAPRVQQTVQNLILLIQSMPVGCGPDSSLPFPFYITSRELVTDAHRAWVRQRNRELKQVYPGRTRDALMALLEQIWSAVDAKREAREARNRDADGTVRRLERNHDFCLL